jgi:hypothetical protein
MPLYYDLSRVTTSNASGNTQTFHMFLQTIANQETSRITGLFANAINSSTVGSGQLRMATNIGAVATGGTSQTAFGRNLRVTSPNLTAKNDASAISQGGSLTTRVIVGFAQTGGQNGWVAVEPSAAVQMGANASNPVDTEIISTTTTGSTPLTFDVEFCEGT